MRKFKLLAASSLLMLFMGTSCSVTYHGVTTNEVGSEKGVAEGSNFGGGYDYSYSTASANGEIGKIATTKVRKTNYFGILYFRTTVTGKR
jgi:hypothetical protein